MKDWLAAMVGASLLAIFASSAGAQTEKQAVESKAPVGSVKLGSVYALQANRPRATEIMHRSCNGSFRIVSDGATSGAHQVEAGLSLPLSGKGTGKAHPYIYYSCSGKN